MIIKPLVHRVLVRQDKIEEKLGSVIVRAQANVKDEQLAQVAGTVVALGPYAWSEYPDSKCEVGDRVFFQRYSGMKIPDGKGGFYEEGKLIVLNDLDIVSKVIEEEA